MASKTLTAQMQRAIIRESQRCEESYLWLQAHMPPRFFEERSEEDILLIVHSLMGFKLQDYFSQVHLKDYALVLCLDSDDADLRILENYQNYGIRDYFAFVSNAPPPFEEIKTHLRIAVIYFTHTPNGEDILDTASKYEIQKLVKTRNPKLTEREFKQLLNGISPRFLRTMTKERLSLAIDMYFRAQTRDCCQYEVRYNKDWKGKEIPSMQIILAWRNVPKHHFLYKLAQVIHRHGLAMRRINATYIDPYTKDSTLIMSIGLHGANNKPTWEATDLVDFLRELVIIKYFENQETLEKVFVDSGWISGNLGNLLKAMSHFIHQMLVHADPYLYSLSNIEEGLCRHPEITTKLLQAFEQKFHPENHALKTYEKTKKEFQELIEDLDTGNESNDRRRKNILTLGLLFVDFTLKTNFYRNNKTAFSFRLDPQYFKALPYDYKEKFPEIPFAIFFMKGMYYIGFHIRFKDLSRGGLRTIFPQKLEQMLWERNNVFSECYNLAYTQQKKNKDIPEGGSKGVIFIEPYEWHAEANIYKEEMKKANLNEGEMTERLKVFIEMQKIEYLYQTQRSYIESFVTLLNCEVDGRLRAKHVVDYWKRPEYIYLGPDENMHNSMIEWIANYAKYYQYKPGSSFITSKPVAGINHKEFGVTSFGVNVYLFEMLKYLGIDPSKDSFTIKISGGPDGDVAGNQILNLYKYCPTTAKLLALTDISGTIYDPSGLDLQILSELFKESKSIRHYPAEKLSEGGFLLDLFTRREQTAYAQQTLLQCKENGHLIDSWLSGSEMNHLFRTNVHQVRTDIFIPAGGRPRTLNENNYKEFLDESGKPTARAIIEGANLYLTPAARRALELLGVLIIKDSSANKGGVICSSFEVLLGLTLSDEEFIREKAKLMQEVLQIIGDRARDEARLLLSAHTHKGLYLTDISDLISQHITTYKYQILDHLQDLHLSNDSKHPFIRCLLHYCPLLLRSKYKDRILKEIPDGHKKAIIATYLASRVVYQRGLDWAPNIVDILPLLTQDKEII